VKWDRSSVEVQARDVAALGWVADQYAIRADALGVLLRRLAPGGGHCGLPGGARFDAAPAVGERRIRQVVERWGEAGWVHRHRLLGHAWIVPRQAGIVLAGRPYREWPPNARMLDHIHAVGLVRLAVEAELPAASWRCEREIRRQVAHGDRKPAWRIPDAEVLHEPAADVLAVEVELTQKDRARFERNLRLVDPATTATSYFAPPELAARLARWVREYNQRRQQSGHTPLRVQVHTLPEVSGLSYGGAA